MENVLFIIVIIIVALGLIINEVHNSKVTKELAIYNISKLVDKYTDFILDYAKDKIENFTGIIRQNDFSDFQYTIYKEIFEWVKETIKNTLKSGEVVDDLIAKYIDNASFEEQLYDIIIKILNDNGISELLDAKYEYLISILEDTSDKIEEVIDKEPVAVEKDPMNGNECSPE